MGEHFASAFTNWSRVSIFILKERSQKCWEWMERYLYRYILQILSEILPSWHISSLAKRVKLPRWKPRYFRSRSNGRRRAIMSSSRCWPSSKNQLTLSDCSNNTNWFVEEEQRPRQTSVVWPIPVRMKNQRWKGSNWDVNRCTIHDLGRHAWDDTRVHLRDVDGT